MYHKPPSESEIIAMYRKDMKKLVVHYKEMTELCPYVAIENQQYACELLLAQLKDLYDLSDPDTNAFVAYAMLTVPGKYCPYKQLRYNFTESLFEKYILNLLEVALYHSSDLDRIKEFFFEFPFNHYHPRLIIEFYQLCLSTETKLAMNCKNLLQDFIVTGMVEMGKSNEDALNLLNACDTNNVPRITEIINELLEIHKIAGPYDFLLGDYPS